MSKDDHSKCFENLFTKFERSKEKFDRVRHYIDKNPHNLIHRSSVKSLLRIACRELEGLIMQSEQAFKTADNKCELKRALEFITSLKNWIQNQPIMFSDLNKYEGGEVFTSAKSLKAFKQAFSAKIQIVWRTVRVCGSSFHSTKLCGDLIYENSKKIIGWFL